LSTSRLWVCGNILIYVSVVLSLFRTIWVALHDYGYICNFYVVDHYFMRWYLRLEFYYVILWVLPMLL
jgi:hypothetical protein